MDTRHWNAAGGSQGTRGDEPPYAGTSGQTRVEVAQLMLPSGQAVSVQVHRVVNVATDPHLGTPALAGILHRYDVGFELSLAVPFVYHDPAKHRFALVVPEALRHEELRLRAKLLEDIAEDPANPAPGYVREATTVVGVQALREYLERGDGRAAVAAAEVELARRDRELGGREGRLRDRETALKVREERLVKRAEGVTSREDELAERAEEIEAAARDVALRERELAARMESLQEAEQRLVAREKELGSRSAEPARSVLDAVVRASAAESSSVQIFGAALPPLATSIGLAPAAARPSAHEGPSNPIPSLLTSSSMPAHPAPAHPASREPQEPRRAGAGPATASAPIPSLASASVHHPAAGPHPHPTSAASGPIPSLAHPVSPAPAGSTPPSTAASASPAAPSGSAVVAPASSLAASGAVHASTMHGASAGAQPPRPASVPPPPPGGARPQPEPSVQADEDDVVEDATDLVVESTGFVRLDEVEELAEEEDVEELDVIDEVTGVGRVPERPRARIAPPAAPPAAPGVASASTPMEVEPVSVPRDARPEPITVEEAVDDGKTSVALPPKPRSVSVVVPGAWWRSGSQAHVSAADGTVRFFFRADDELAQSVSEGCEVRCQLATTVDGAPVVLLSVVVGQGASARAVARAVLDTGREEERRVLDTLRRSYRFSVVPVGALGQATAAIDAVSPREVNVARLMERLARFGGAEREHGALSLRALERVLAEPPPLFDPDDPFAGEPEEPLDAAQALAAVQRLHAGSTPEHLEHALLVLSIPNDRVDALFRRTLEAAVRFGVALPETLERRALALGVAEDRASLVTRQVAAFGEVLSGKLPSELSAEAARTNWESLVRAAADADVGIDPSVAELASAELGTGAAAAAAAPPPDPGVLALLETPELVRRLETGPGRDVIALELCRRSATESVEALGRAARKMSRDEVVRVVPSMLRLGESVGDVLVEGLGAREAHVRQAAALGLGVLRLRRAAVPLIHLLLSESTDAWHEVARALGEFGSSAVRPIIRFLKEPKGREDRLAEALAHLSRACLQDVEKLSRDENPAAASIAQRALAIRPGILELDDGVRGQRPLVDAAAEATLSRRFFEELASLGDFRLASREMPTD